MDEILKDVWSFIKKGLGYAYGDDADIKSGKTIWAIAAFSIISGLLAFFLFCWGKKIFNFQTGFKRGIFIVGGSVAAIVMILSFLYNIFNMNKTVATKTKENTNKTNKSDSSCKYLGDGVKIVETLKVFPANVKVSLDPVGYLEMVFLTEGNATHIKTMPKRIHVMFKSEEFIELIARHRYGTHGEGYQPYIEFHKKRKRIIDEGLKQGMVIEELHYIDSLIDYCKKRRHNGVDISLDPKYFRDMLRRWKMLLIAQKRAPEKCKYYVRLTDKDIFLKYEIIDNDTVLIHEPVGNRSKTRLNALMIQGNDVTKEVERDFRERWEHQCIDERNRIDYRDNESVITFIDTILFPIVYESDYEKRWFHRLQDIRDEFKGRAGKYLQYTGRNEFDEIVESLIRDLLNDIGKKGKKTLRVIEVGSGIASLSSFILHNCLNIKKIVALDICEEMILGIKDFGIEGCVAPAEEMPFDDNSFDIVIAKNSLQYLNTDSHVRFISELHRIITPGGHFILVQTTPCSDDSSQELVQRWIDSHKCAEPLSQSNYTKQQWIDLFSENHFTLKNSDDINVRTSVGKWEKQTAQIDSTRVGKYKEMLINSSEQFKDLYKISEIRGDVLYTEVGCVFDFVDNK